MINSRNLIYTNILDLTWKTIILTKNLDETTKFDILNTVA